VNDIAAIAAGLTKAQRETVLRWAGSHSEVIDLALDPLWYCIIKDAPDQFRLTPTKLGMAVRAHLVQQDPTA
jgi:hypothetical protein